MACDCVDELGEACAECHTPIRDKWPDDWLAKTLLEKEFKPCVQVFDDPKRTEMVLRDCAMVWRWYPHLVDAECGYDVETGELVAIRVYGDVSRRE